MRSLGGSEEFRNQNFGPEIPTVLTSMKDAFVLVLRATHLLGVKGTIRGITNSNAYVSKMYTEDV